MVNCEECTRECKYHHDKWKDGECEYYAAITEFLDHTALISWFQYASHKAASVNKKDVVENVNFDGREYIKLPSGRCVKITLRVEYLGEWGVDYRDN